MQHSKSKTKLIAMDLETYAASTIPTASDDDRAGLQAVP
jgi:hypothetical protein